MPPPFPSVRSCTFLLAVALLVIICDLSISNYELYLSFLSSKPQSRQRYTNTKRLASEFRGRMGYHVMRVELLTLQYFLSAGAWVRTYIQSINFLISRFTIDVHLKRAYFCKVGRRVIMDINMAACQLSVKVQKQYNYALNKKNIADF